MLDSIPFTLLIATVLGFLAGLGVGGGSLLVLWVTLVINMDPTSARLLNLLFFIPSAVIATFFHKKQGRLNFKKVLPAIIGGCIAAALFSVVAKHLDAGLIKKLFGVLLLFTGLRELFYKKSYRRKAK